MPHPPHGSTTGSPTVLVTTGSRLHFGPLAVGAIDRPSFGGVGMMIDNPGFTLRFSRLADGPSRIEGPESERVQRTLNRLTENHFPDSEHPVHIVVERHIPPHGGLGSGTQLGLAIARGLSELRGHSTPDLQQLIEATGRGRRSAIGVYGFQDGGLILDSGKPSPDELGGYGGRVDVPEEWRFLLWTPPGEGLSGAEERAVFASLPPMSRSLSDRLTDIATHDLLPAAASDDFRHFAASLWEFGSLVGDYFAPTQGGLFSHSQGAEVVARLQAAGVIGIAQSSWGPTLCAVVPNSEVGNHIIASVVPPTGHFTMTAAKNQGAQIESPSAKPLS